VTESIKHRIQLMIVVNFNLQWQQQMTTTRCLLATTSNANPSSLWTRSHGENHSGRHLAAGASSL